MPCKMKDHVSKLKHHKPCQKIEVIITAHSQAFSTGSMFSNKHII
jgi:hypothetical protein